MRFYAVIIAILALVPTMAARTIDEVPNVHVQDRTRYVSNPDNVLSQAAVDSLDATLDSIWTKTTAEPAVVVIDDLPADSDIDTYATDLFRKWGIGKKDNNNGLLILVARNDRKAVIRTGYGMEGVLPDLVASRLLREEMFPRFREGDYDGGVIATVNEVERILTDPAYSEELKSKYANDEALDDTLFDVVFSVFMIIGVAGLLYVIFLYRSALRKEDRVERWNTLKDKELLVIVSMGFTMFMTLPASLLLLYFRHRVRAKADPCPRCGHKMKKFSEKKDNLYLTPSQDLEEKIKSVDYDVQQCPTCGYIAIDAFVNKTSSYKPCKKCGARTSHVISQRILKNATTRSKGAGLRIYRCENCGNKEEYSFVIPMITATTSSYSSGGSSGGGFSSGGSFGGGSTGGGGASGGW
mgnify:FL=1